jgi:hypothetical protein
VQANDAAFSGAGSNYSRCTFATATMQTRLTLFDLGTPSVDLRGTYRVFLRCRKNTSTDAVNVQLRYGDASLFSFVTNDSVALADTTALRLYDLGLLTVPRGFDPVYDLRSGVELPVDDSVEIQVRAERTSGAGTLDLDYLILVPADDRFAAAAWPTSSGPASWWLDAFDNSIHARTASDEISPTPAPSLTGGLPMLSPSQTNRIYMFHVATSGTHTISGTDAVSVSYYPLYLTVRPAST